MPAAPRDSLLELTFDPALSQVVFRVDGQRVSTAYQGHTENQKGLGLAWGSANDMGSAPVGRADFRLVLLEIR